MSLRGWLESVCQEEPLEDAQPADSFLLWDIFLHARHPGKAWGRGQIGNIIGAYLGKTLIKGGFQSLKGRGPGQGSQGLRRSKTGETQELAESGRE